MAVEQHLSQKRHLETDDEAPEESQQTSNLMPMARGLLKLVGPYLEEKEDACLGTGADFLAQISDAVSRAINILAAKAAAGDVDGTDVDLRRPPRRPSPPQNQSKEDKRIMIRLNSQHEARKAEPFLLRQQVLRLIPDPSLVVDAWQVPSGIAILAPTPAKAGSILEHKDAIAARFGNATVERQETWTTFVVGPIPKKVVTLEGAVDPVDGLLQSEPAKSAIMDTMPNRQLTWTKRSVESANPDGFIRIHVPEAKVHKFPSRMQLFGRATGVQRVRLRSQLTTCSKCFGFHATRTCAHQYKCGSCGKDAHEGPCALLLQCLNCRGSHSSIDIPCPARPRRDHGVFIRPNGARLRHIRAAGRKELARSLNRPQESPVPVSQGAAEHPTSPN
ncbi:hypothetical protein K3495_g8830 [Podosphaera aphanis]|nr:hypothetical protein K3495_g8830 [Podosphaera aphanis]